MGGGKKARKQAARLAKRAEKRADQEKARANAQAAEQNRIDEAKKQEQLARTNRGLVSTILSDEEENKKKTKLGE